jgi:hypothetical protein
MDFVIGVSVALALAAAGLLAYLVRKISGGSRLPVTAAWIEDLSLERYRPMLRMLDDSDIDFLRSQPGFTPGMASKLRTQRAKIFRGYLKNLESDFARVCSAIKMIMLQSNHDRPELANSLLRRQVAFACAMLSARALVLFYRMGVCGVDVTRLVRLFDSTRLELRTLAPVSTPAAA